VDSASDSAPRPRLTPSAPHVPPRPGARHSLPLFLLRFRIREASSSSPRSSSRTLPQTPQDANSPSSLSLRTAPQWPHRHHANGAVAVTPAIVVAGSLDHVATYRQESVGREATYLDGFKRCRLGIASVFDFATPLLIRFPTHVRSIPRWLYIGSSESVPRRLGNQNRSCLVACTFRWQPKFTFFYLRNTVQIKSRYSCTYEHSFL
jgi:hypothetical protein